MIKHNLKEIVNFSKLNNDFSDFNIVNNFKLNFNKYKSINYKKQFGGSTTVEDYNLAIQQLQQLPPESQDYADIVQRISTLEQDPLVQQYIQSQNLASQAPSAREQELGQVDEGEEAAPEEYVIPEQINNAESENKFNTTLIRSSDSLNTYTIPKGTILYYSTTDRKGFNVNSIKLYGSGYLNNSSEPVSFFTPNFRLASDKIQGCSIDKQKGYIHTFRVIREIPDIFIKLPYDMNDGITVEDIHKDFCEGSEKYLGVGFFYPKNEIEIFNNNINNKNIQNINGDEFYSEYYLCNPRPYVEYMYSQKCMSLRKLSTQYKFT
jgi:hypothetical protein